MAEITEETLAMVEENDRLRETLEDVLGFLGELQRGALAKHAATYWSNYVAQTLAETGPFPDGSYRRDS